MIDTLFDIDWNDKHKDLEYTVDYFKDNSVLNLWESSGIKKDQTKIYLHQMTKPYIWMNHVVTQINNRFNLSNCTYAFHKITPGNFLAMHSDYYAYFKKNNNIVDSDRIKRIIIFLEDGHPGHILIVNNVCYINWKKGAYASWVGSDPHLAANLGICDRYTLQITGVIND
jgi:hypothetical protein